MPSGVGDLGVEVHEDMQAGLADADVVMMLRLQKERMDGGFIPSEREYYHRWGLDAAKLAGAKPDAIVMHPGPMNARAWKSTAPSPMTSTAASFRIRSRWAWPCAWPAWICWRATCGPNVGVRRRAIMFERDPVQNYRPGPASEAPLLDGERVQAIFTPDRARYLRDHVNIGKPWGDRGNGGAVRPGAAARLGTVLGVIAAVAFRGIFLRSEVFARRWQ